MDTLTAIHSRRSIRSWTGEPVSEKDLDTLLRAGMAAPSSDNAQPWHFVVIKEKASLHAIADANTWSPMAPKADIGILVCSELSLEKTPDMWLLDCSAAIQNILLAATSIGLGAVWVGIHYDPALVEVCRKLLQLPEGVEPHSLVLVGHPSKGPKPKDRFKPERIHREHW